MCTEILCRDGSVVRQRLDGYNTQVESHPFVSREHSHCELADCRAAGVSDWGITDSTVVQVSGDGYTMSPGMLLFMSQRSVDMWARLADKFADFLRRANP